MFTPDIARQAAARWSKTPPAAQSIPNLLTAHAESDELREQRQNRVARLSNIASASKASALALAADATPGAAGKQADVLNTFERVIGPSNILGIDFLELAIATARGIGRVRCDNEYGTGVLVGPRLMMTNNHVIGKANATDGWVIDLDYQQNSEQQMLPVHTYRVDINYFFYTSEELDYTIIGLAQTSDKGKPVTAYPWTKMLADTGKLEIGDSINIIQHPDGGLKKIAFRENTVIGLTNAKPNFLDYTTDTQPGSSGSGCFNDQWELVALHHSGVPDTDAKGNIKTTKNQVWRKGADPANIKWIGNEGIRISAIVKDLSAATLQAGFKAIVQSILTQDPPNPIELARTGQPANPASLAPSPYQPVPASAPSSVTTSVLSSKATGDFTFQLPLTISVSLGEQVHATIATSSATSTLPAEEAVVIDPDWKARPGYDPAFLGASTTVPLPGLTAAQLKTTAQVAPEFRAAKGPYAKFELRYWNYSVLMNLKYRTAWFSAANVDGDERFNLPARKGDKWFADPRIDATQQLDQSAFEKGMDRGHLTRREDAAWGKTADIATKSLNDTFHFTNCSLQASLFNRGQDRWQGLERFLLENHAEKDNQKIMVFTGPVFDPSNPLYRNTAMNYSVPCPLQFWKVCVLIRATDGKLSSTGFILGQQDIAQLPGFEAFDVGAAQITLKQLETKTKLNFGKLKDFDHFAKTGQPGTLERFVAGGKQRFLHTFDEIVV
jgi:endonuclease G